jgi:hypothetical protein
MDEAIHFDLPGKEQRGKLLALYLDKYITKAGTEQVSEAAAAAAAAEAAAASLSRHIVQQQQSVSPRYVNCTLAPLLQACWYQLVG